VLLFCVNCVFLVRTNSFSASFAFSLQLSAVMRARTLCASATAAAATMPALATAAAAALAVATTKVSKALVVVRQFHGRLVTVAAVS
jgi:hypothetical protein